MKVKQSKKQRQPQLTVDEVCKLAPEVLKGFLKERKQVVLRKLVDKIIINKERTYARIRGHRPIYYQKVN